MKRVLLLVAAGALMAGPARFARLGEFEGKVEVQLTAVDDWIGAMRNLPLPEATWVRTGAGARAEIELDEGSVWRIGPESQCEISDYSRLSTGQRITLLALDRGLAYFTGQAEGKDALMLAVPGAQVTVSRGARLRLEVQESWSRISVLQGTARFSSPAAEIDLREGQSTRIEPANPARFFLDREILAMEPDKWSEARDKALGNSSSAGHVIERYGLADLDPAGEWIETKELGAVWKPKVDDTWVPYRNGRWRWYDALGYTWVSGEVWGWLPYHYGRWMRRENLGWIWVPSKTAVFKPGEVYWLRGAKIAGWGPLAPGEEWKPGPPANDQPRQFLNVNTTFANFQQDAMEIDPAGFTTPPKEPLLIATLALALPSPAFVASRLDAVRPLIRANRTRVVPVLEGVTFESNALPPVVVVNPAPPAPVVVITPPAQTQAPEPDPVVVPAPYPVPVYAVVKEPERTVQTTLKSNTPAPSKITKAQPPTSRRPESGGRDHSHASTVMHEKKFHSGEQRMAEQAIAEVNGRNFARALTALDNWSQRYPESEYQDDRLYYYAITYDGMRQPAKVVDTVRRLVSGEVPVAFQDPRQMILACYLSSVNAQKVTNPTSAQFMAGVTAARILESMTEEYFTPRNKPPETSDADWAKTRSELEATAKNTLTILKTHSGLPDSSLLNH